MTAIMLHYTVPVTVVVDPLSRAVVRVVVEDELVAPNDHQTAAPAKLKEAFEVADTKDWPKWDFGW